MTKKQLESNERLKKAKLAESSTSKMRESSKNKEEKKAHGNGKSSAISGLSSSTQALLKKALDAKKPATPQQKSS